MAGAGLTDILTAVQNGVTAMNNLAKLLTGATVSSSSLRVTGVSTTTGTVTQINTGIGLTGGPITASGSLAVSLPALTNTTSADITATTTGYVDGPSVAQGTSGSWFASGQVTVRDNAGVAIMSAKLWDGSAIINSAAVSIPAAGEVMVMPLTGVLTNPSGNIRISVLDGTSSRGVILFNQSGNSKDSTLTVVRIA